LSNPHERWIAMPPEDRQIFRRNAERWLQMGPEERMIMRQREKMYRAQVQREVDAALRDSGLRLEGEKRAQFEQRYLQERRRIEHSFREEIESKRRQELPVIQERLKKEFQETSPSGSSTAAPAAAGAPKK
jgi:hypothetical protein